MNETQKTPFLKSKTVRWIWLSILIFIPILLWLTPADYFDERSVFICPSEFIFSIDCISCDVTRGVLHMHHFEMDDAVYYTTISPVIYIALVVIWFIWVKGTLKSLGILKNKEVAEVQ